MRVSFHAIWRRLLVDMTFDLKQIHFPLINDFFIYEYFNTIYCTSLFSFFNLRSQFL